MMDDPTIEQVIDGYRRLPLLGGIEDRANGIAQFFSQSPKVAVAVERIDGTVAHFVQSTMIEDFDGWTLNGRMGDPYRFAISRFEIDMAPHPVPRSIEAGTRSHCGICGQYGRDSYCAKSGCPFPNDGDRSF
jgi:hypothetical protein